MENKRDLSAWKPSCVASYSEELPRWCVSEERIGNHMGTQPPTASFTCGRSQHHTFFL